MIQDRGSLSIENIMDEQEGKTIIEKKEIQKPQRNKLFSLEKMLLMLVVTCWLVPIIIIFVTMSVSYREGMIRKTESLLMDDVKNFSDIISYYINDGINISKNVSYELQLEKEWKEYNRGGMSSSEFYRKASSIMGTKFGHDKKFKEAIFYLTDEPNKIYPSTLSEIAFFNGKLVEVSKEITSMDTSKAFVKVIDGRVFIIRNMYAVQGYKKFATLVVELNTDKLFRGMTKNDIYDIGFYIDKSDSIVSHNKDLKKNIDKSEILMISRNYYKVREENESTVSSNKTNKYLGYIYQDKQKDYLIETVLIVNKSDIFSELNTLNYLIVVLLIGMIPIFIFVVCFISRNVTKPITKLVEISKEIRSGNIGVQIDGDKDTMPNKEFAYLMVSFNKMSSKIKYLFDYAYDEQLARKDAKIMALQSQINPHFLNNTLEMMNWQARMVGDVKVSKMIEALSTLLDYSMDRTNKRSISLSEEIRCADAYCYIVSMRFGKRLLIEKEIDENALQIRVPQLILQPLLENAVVHGVEAIKNGTIWLKVYKEEDTVILQVVNTGKTMSEEEILRVEHILNGDRKTEPIKGEYVALGIKNVNERIKLIYGEQYGLTIKPIGEGITAATITIPSTLL